MFDEAPTTEEEWRVLDEEQLLAAEYDAWLVAFGGFTREQMLAEKLVENRAAAARLAAEQYRAIDDLRLEVERTTGATHTDRNALVWRELRAEVAAVLQVHERTAERMLDLARELVHRFPSTLAALGRAEVTDRHARILADEAATIPDDLAGEYEARLLPYAMSLPPRRFEAIAATIRAQLCPSDLIERHREALQERRTAVEPGPDGMAWYGVYTDAADVIGADAAVDGIARSLLVEGETRTLAQIKADVFRDLLIDAGGVTNPAVAGEAPRPTPAAQRGVRPDVALHVPVFTAMGLTDDPAVLEGYGPIDAVTARRLAGCATGFLRVLTDPETGTVISVGKDPYVVPGPMRRALKLRDEVCRFVGCTRPARFCDIDHTVPWSEHGPTVMANLAHLCRGHHRLKHGSRWKVAHTGGSRGGTLTWTSPAGQVYTSAPTVTLPPTRNGPRPGAATLIQQEWVPDATAPF